MRYLVALAIIIVTILAILAAGALTRALASCNLGRTDLTTPSSSLIQLESQTPTIWLLYDIHMTTLLAHSIGTVFTFPSQSPGWYLVLSMPLPPSEGWRICPINLTPPPQLTQGDT